MEPLATGKRRRPASASLSPPPPPRQPTRDDENSARSWKKRRLESATTEGTEEKRLELRSPEPEEKDATPKGKRRRSVSPEKKEIQEETSNSCSSNDEKQETKRRRVGEEGGTSSSPLDLPASPLANLSGRHLRTSAEQEKRPTEEKARFPPSPIVIPPREEDDDISNRENVATYTNLEDFVVSSQGSDADLVAACANLENDVVDCSQGSQNSDVERVRQRTSLRTVQVTPPPSARMMDRKNPPPPPKRPRRNYRRGIVYARAYPRLALSPLVDNSPPSSPRVFRSLENEFAFAMQDTPEIRPRVRPAPRMARGSRRSTRAGSSRARRSLDTPTSTMVLRSRLLNPSLSADGGKPENQREREQRDAQRRHE
ncbi:uncharacterized protein PITG_09700 [Phytophthora infestans T30-4]|uniref:Uncharacterized protein n=1 Tax=Phytophthora infestans (strain T30-4) TaxID=403677 RepID=D0NCL5_PHYIT|nr:uncharacterized protein PITG_09700 [Phytophthora infestans T30-4]EEY55729.1 conserved hypothetical protein [Phytophthora infestans T30-4]|eukprot:XP_002903305.1 conserved hypothetical protein [Phytophthora infestans T30-4]